MSVITILMPDAQHECLKALAKSQGVSVNKLMEELATRALTEFDVETRFRTRAAHGSAKAGLALLDRVENLSGKERLGFMEGYGAIPDDIKTPFKDDIEEMFYGNPGKFDRLPGE